MRPGKRRLQDSTTGAGSERKRTARAPAPPPPPSAVATPEVEWFPLSVWFAVTMLVVPRERWTLWQQLLLGADVHYVEGRGVVRSIVDAPAACKFTKAAAFCDVRTRITLKPTAGGGACRGQAVAARRPGGGWAIDDDDEEARQRTGITFTPDTLLLPHHPTVQDAWPAWPRVWPCAATHDNAGRVTSTMLRTLPELLGTVLSTP